MKLHHHFKILFLSIFLLSSLQNASWAANVISDSVITGKIKSKIAMDRSLSVFKIKVSTKKGVVALVGKVNSDTDAGALIQLTQATDGVNDINASNLDIKNSKQPFTDMVITAKIKGLFLREKLMGTDVAAMNMHVETKNGIVYLSGNVDNQEEIHNAMKLAQSVKGVKKVESRLQVVNTTKAS